MSAWKPSSRTKKEKSDDFLTDPLLVRSLGEFDLDPCSSVYQDAPLAARSYRWPEHNGLLLEWSGRVWCNPPYTEIRKWTERMILHNNGVFLIPARTSTLAFEQIWSAARGILFPFRRLKYWRPDGRQYAHFWGDALCVFGLDNACVDALRYCNIAGVLVTQKEIVRGNYRNSSKPGSASSSASESETHQQPETETRQEQIDFDEEAEIIYEEEDREERNRTRA